MNLAGTLSSYTMKSGAKIVRSALILSERILRGTQENITIRQMLKSLCSI